MKSSKVLYIVLNKDETLYMNKQEEPMIYRNPKNFINQERFKECKVAIFNLSEIKDIDSIQKDNKK